MLLPTYPLSRSSFYRKGCLAAAFALFLSMFPPGLSAQTHEASRAVSLKDEMRMFWTRDDARFIRSWLVAGPYQEASDGEGAIGPAESSGRPAEGALLKLSDGSSLPWRRHDSWGDTNNLEFQDKGEGPRVAFAWTKIVRSRSGKALLSLGSDEGVAVWVNGKQVFVRDGRRPFSPDADQVEVELIAGDNELLLKVAQSSGDWLFSVRVLESGSILPRPQEIYPSLVGDSTESLSMRTDNGKVDASGAPVTVEVLAPGGRVLASRTAQRGAEIGFDAHAWPDGPYELRCATLNFEKRAYVGYFGWYKGDSLAKARELSEAAAKARGASPYCLTLRMLAELVEHRLGSKADEAKGNPWEKIHSPLMEFEELKLENEGGQSRVRPGGLARFAYVDELDGSPQFCRAYLPENYDPARKWPLVVNLHGSHPQNPPYVGWWNVDTRHPGPNLALPSGQGYVLLEPHGRGNNEYQYFGISENDLLRGLDEARRRFNIDPDRIYLIGSSMGGWGAWKFASRHPDLFAALEPIFGGSDYHAEMTDAALSRLDAAARFQAEKRSSWAMAENLMHLPIYVQHGDADKSVNVDFSRWGVRFLQRWGYDLRYREYPGRGHEDMIDGASAARNMEWLLAQRRDANPRHVRLRTAELRHASAYWVHVDQIENPLEFAAVDAEVAGDNLVRLDTDKVLAVSLSPSAPLIDPSRPLTVVWNGARQECRLVDGRLRLTDPRYSPVSTHKTSRLPGSMQDFTHTPFAVVVGTTSQDPAMAEACARKAAAFVEAWRKWQHASPRLFKDTEIADEEIAGYSLLLVGGPAENKVASRFADRVPLRIEKESIVIDGKAWEARDAAVQLLYPNPQNAERYLLVVAATSAAGLNNSDLDPKDMPGWDYFVSDGRLPGYGQKAFSHQLRIVSGCFDYNWRFSAASNIEGDTSIRSVGRSVLYPGMAGSPGPETLAEYLGKYESQNGSALEVVGEGAGLLLRGPGFRFDMFPVSETDFWIPAAKVQLRAQRNSAGKITGFEGSSEAGEETLKMRKL